MRTKLQEMEKDCATKLYKDVENCLSNWISVWGSEVPTECVFATVELVLIMHLKRMIDMIRIKSPELADTMIETAIQTLRGQR